jgi:hypothetical protein
MEAKPIGGVLENRHMPGRPAGERQRGEHLQVTQLGCPRQQVSDQQHAQRGDVRTIGRSRRMRAYPQRARTGRPDLGV